MANKKHVRITRLDRKCDPSLSCPQSTFKYNYIQEVNVSEQELVNGVLVTKNTIKKVDIRERDKGLNYWDFSIDSLAASGAAGDLKYCQLSGDKLEMADNIDIQASKVPVQDNDNKNIEG